MSKGKILKAEYKFSRGELAIHAHHGQQPQQVIENTKHALVNKLLEEARKLMDVEVVDDFASGSVLVRAKLVTGEAHVRVIEPIKTALSPGCGMPNSAKDVFAQKVYERAMKPSFFEEIIKETIKRNWAGTKYLLSDIGETIMSKQFWETGRNFNGSEDEVAKLPKIHVLVDGDIVAYRAAASCDGRYYAVEGTSEKFSYKKEAVAFCDKKSIPNSKIISGYDPEPEENALHNTNVTISNIRDYYIYQRSLNPVITIFLSGARNFRYDIFPDYKKNRKKQRRPHHLETCKEHLIKHNTAHRYEGFEADDLIGMTVTALNEKGVEISIASNDKDFTQLGGGKVEQFDFTTGKSWKVEPEEAVYYFYKQILVGDKSDGIPGLPKVGPQTAIKILGGSTDEKELYSKVVLAYKEKLEMEEDAAVALVKLKGQLLYLLREEGKMWEPPQL